MKFLSRLLSALLLAVLAFTAAPARADDGAFRNFIWGVSKADVRQFESAVFYKGEGNSLYFILKPDQYMRQIKYDFTDGKLSAARFEYTELAPPTADMVLELFYKEEAALKAELGDPAREDFTFKDKTYKNFPQFWGRSLMSKDLQIRIEWDVHGTRTVLRCYYDGSLYQLYYTAEPSVRDLPTPETILDLPQQMHTNP